MMCGLLSSHADPTSAPPAEQIPMGYDEKQLQSGRPRTILPDVTAERSNSIVSVHVKRSSFPWSVCCFLFCKFGIDRSKESKIRLNSIVIPLPILMGNGTASDTL